MCSEVVLAVVDLQVVIILIPSHLLPVLIMVAQVVLAVEAHTMMQGPVVEREMPVAQVRRVATVAASVEIQELVELYG